LNAWGEFLFRGGVLNFACNHEFYSWLMAKHDSLRERWFRRSGAQNSTVIYRTSSVRARFEITKKQPSPSEAVDELKDYADFGILYETGNY